MRRRKRRGAMGKDGWCGRMWWWSAVRGGSWLAVRMLRWDAGGGGGGAVPGRGLRRVEWGIRQRDGGMRSRAHGTGGGGPTVSPVQECSTGLQGSSAIAREKA